MSQQDIKPVEVKWTRPDNYSTMTRAEKNRWNARFAGLKNKGRLKAKTVEARIAAREVVARVIASKDKLLNAQFALAYGLTFLYRIKYDRKTGRPKPEIVKDQSLITAFLAGELEGDGYEYYFMGTEKPDGHAIDSLLNRGLGEAVKRVALVDGEGENLFRPTDDERRLSDAVLGEVDATMKRGGKLLLPPPVRVPIRSVKEKPKKK